MHSLLISNHYNVNFRLKYFAIASISTNFMNVNKILQHGGIPLLVDRFFSANTCACAVSGTKPEFGSNENNFMKLLNLCSESSLNLNSVQNTIFVKDPSRLVIHSQIEESEKSN